MSYSEKLTTEQQSATVAAAEAQPALPDAAGKPLIIYKVGVLGCAPINFMQKLAEDYNWPISSSDVIRKKMIAERDAAARNEGRPVNRAPNIKSQTIRNRIKSQIAGPLREGQDVVIDMFCNNARTREWPTALAQQFGATTVALCMDTNYEKALERVKIWTAQDAFIVPRSRWEVSPVRAVLGMMGTTEWPTSAEPIDYVFDLDGSQGNEQMLAEFGAKMREAGLITDPQPPLE